MQFLKKLKTDENSLSENKVGCIFPMVISPEIQLGQYRDADHQEDTPHFTILCTGPVNRSDLTVL